MKVHQSAMMLVSWLLLSIPAALAHTWVEQMTVIAPNGTFVGEPGYPRGYMDRQQAGFEGNMVYLLPPNGRANTLLASDNICKSSQTIGNQTPAGPALVASPGDNIALRYQENGHVTLPNTQIGKPANRGTVYIYGTTQPKNDDKILGIHKVWNAAGTGGDGRGVLLSTRNFDDGQCYQLNGGNISTYRNQVFKHNTADPLMGVNLWCQNDVKLPADVDASTYTLYWVWDWPTAANVTGSGEPNGKIEIYTTCMDVTMKAKSAAAASKGKTVNQGFIAGQQLDYAGIPDQLNNAFQVPVAQANEPVSSPSSTSTVSFATATATGSSSSSSVTGAATPTSTNVAVVTVTVTATQQITITVSAPGPSSTSTSTTVAVNTTAPAATAGKPQVTPFVPISSSLTQTAILPVQTGAAALNGTLVGHKKLRFQRYQE